MIGDITVTHTTHINNSVQIQITTKNKFIFQFCINSIQLFK